MKTPLRLIPAVALLVTLAGCGNKGPLVHPPRPADDMAVPATSALPGAATMAVPASTAPAAPVDATLPTPASTAPAAATDTATPPAETTPPPPPPPGGD